MTLAETMAALELYGTEQNRKVFANHGAGPNTFGVSFANLGALKKKIKTDHALACALWETGNTDARYLAMMIADPIKVTVKELESWAKSLDYYVHADAVSKVAAASPHALDLAEKWAHSKHDYTAQVAYDVYAGLALSQPDLPDSLFEALIKEIETTIHTRTNRARHAMNNLLIAIALRNESLRKRAIAAAKKIGKVEVDHGKTGCKTPDAVAYIEKSLEYREKQAAKQAAKKAKR